MSLLEMKHIKKEFSGVSVIRDISFSVEQGEILAIIGPSGSGKSTLLRCATMLETIENGEILYMGKKAVWTENGKLFLAKKQQRREIESCFGLVFQNFVSAFFSDKKYYRCPNSCAKKREGNRI